MDAPQLLFEPLGGVLAIFLTHSRPKLNKALTKGIDLAIFFPYSVSKFGTKNSYAPSPFASNSESLS